MRLMRLTRRYAPCRYDYMSDVASLMSELDIGWTWWNFRGGGGSGWTHGSSEVGRTDSSRERVAGSVRARRRFQHARRLAASSVVGTQHARVGAHGGACCGAPLPTPMARVVTRKGRRLAMLLLEPPDHRTTRENDHSHRPPRGGSSDGR